MAAGFIGLQLCYYVFLLIYSASRYVLNDLDEISVSLTVSLFMAFVVTLLSGKYPRFISVLLTMCGSMLLFDGIAYFLGIETFKPYGLMIHGTYNKGECFDASGRQLTLCVFFWGAQIVVGLFGLVIQYFTKRFYAELSNRFRGTFNLVREKVGLPVEEEAPEVGEFFEGQKAQNVEHDDEEEEQDLTPTLETTPLLEDRKVIKFVQKQKTIRNETKTSKPHSFFHFLFFRSFSLKNFHTQHSTEFCSSSFWLMPFSTWDG